MATKPNLRENHQDGVSELLTAAMINDLAREVNLDRRLYDVQAFGAVPDSTNGTTGTDSTAAIQAAIDWTATNKGRIYFSPNRTDPSLRYKITSPLVIGGHTAVNCILQGDGNSGIYGTVDGPLIKRDFVIPGVGNGPFIVDGLDLKNYHATNGICVYVQGCINSAIRNCTIKGQKYGIWIDDTTFNTSVSNCFIQSPSGGYPAGQVGLISGIGTNINNVDITGMTTGLVAYGSGCQYTSGRIETCIIGLALGREEDLTTDHPLNAGLFQGLTFEGNTTGIYAYHIGSTEFKAMSFQGDAQPAPVGQSQYGIRVQFSTAVHMSAVIVNVDYSVAGIAFDQTPVTTALTAVSASNGIGPAWVLPSDMTGLTFNQCNVNAADLQANIIAEGESATAPATGAAGTIATSTGVSRVAPAAARTGCILAAGTVGGQPVTVENQSASANSITFAADATSNVADGLAIVIPGLRSRSFRWNSFVARWFTV